MVEHSKNPRAVGPNICLCFELTMTVGFVFGGVARRVIRGARDAKPIKEIKENKPKNKQNKPKIKAEYEFARARRYLHIQIIKTN